MCCKNPVAGTKPPAAVAPGTNKVNTDGKSTDQKTHQTYQKPGPNGKVYSGKTSGNGTPEQNVINRDKNHHMNKEGYGPAKLDKSSSNPNAIRGREQQLIEKNGGAKSQGGTSGNQRNSVGENNKNKELYKKEAEKEFGKSPDL